MIVMMINELNICIRSITMATSNYDLLDYSKKFNIKLDEVVMRDQLNHIQHKNKQNLIINLDSSRSSGTHWAGLLIEAKNALYFDSFGGLPPKEVIAYCKRYKLGYSSFIIQDLSSETCGYYCLAFLHYMQHNKGDLFAKYNDYVICLKITAN